MVTLRELINEKLGIRTRSDDQTGTGVTSTTDAIVLRDDGARVALLFINLGSTAIHIRPRRPATTTIGIRLAPNGGFASMNWETDFTLVGLEWHAVAASLTPELYVLQELIEPGIGGAV